MTTSLQQNSVIGQKPYVTRNKTFITHLAGFACTRLWLVHYTTLRINYTASSIIASF